MKTNKSYTKRLKVTKKGKIIARRPGQGHFNAKESGNISMKKKKKCCYFIIKKNYKTVFTKNKVNFT